MQSLLTDIENNLTFSGVSNFHNHSETVEKP